MLEELMKQYRELEDEKDTKEALVKDVNVRIQEVKGKILSFLESSGLQSAKTAYGSPYVREIKSAKLPETQEQKDALYQWLVERDGQVNADALYTINSRTLQSIINKEIEARKEAGNPDHSIPGIESINTHFDVGIRAK